MRSLILAHFEKAILAGFVSWFLVAGARPLLAHPDDEANAVAAAATVVDTHLSSYKPAVNAHPDPSARLRRDLATPEPVQDFPAWTMHLRPNLLVHHEDGPPPLPTPSHGAPRIDVKRVGHGEVELSWKLGSNEGCDVTGYELLRSTNGPAGPFVHIHTENDPNTTTFVDAAPPASTCTYLLIEHGRTAPSYAPLADEERDVSATSPAAEVPADWFVTTQGGEAAQPAARPPVPGWATLTVHHWNKTAKKFDKRGYQRVNEGSRIGEEPFATNAVLREVQNVNGRTQITIVWSDGHEETTWERVKPKALGEQR